MDKEKTAFFTGHRAIPESSVRPMLSELYSTVCRLILEGYDSFICGGAVGFDTYSAECVLSFRERFPDIRLTLALPCRDQTMKWNSLKDLNKYKSILGRADSVVYVRDFYCDGCMLERNRWMADHSSLCIAYLTKSKGGSAYTYNYSKKIGIRIINIAEKTENPQLPLEIPMKG
ncbi:MAG: DUF1273 domain-containing protein [Ruminococcaceae bacterium]|nr:DUF1273 domain-containing protein [Oscillospiraceae bacterium]